MKPFLKWAGGKRWLVRGHGGLLLAKTKRLIEPFVGSGAVFFHLEPDAALLSDANRELTEAYVSVRDAPEEVRIALLSHQAQHSSEHYYATRASTPASPVERAARLIYLNRTCFNALYRVNLRGEFNVPKGSKDTVLFPDDDFERWSKLLKNADVRAQDFADTVALAGAGDLLYVDPPYTVKHNNNNFVKYNERIFSWADQVRLARALEEATGRGAHVLLSNADHPSVLDLYAGSGWTRISLSRRSVLASSSERRRLTTEIIVSNYLLEDGSVGIARSCS
jgi:DNA adenine methylase